MSVYAARLKQKTIRGALSNVRVWIFLVLRLSEGSPSCFMDSHPVRLYSARKEVNQESADLIAGVLSYWIEHSFEDIDDDDWFCIGD